MCKVFFLSRQNTEKIGFCVIPAAKMDPEEARQRFDAGAVLLCLNVPEGTEFGFDTKRWIVGTSDLHKVWRNTRFGELLFIAQGQSSRE